MSQRRAPLRSSSSSHGTTLPPTTGAHDDEIDDDDGVDMDPLIQKAKAVKSLQLEPGSAVDEDGLDADERYEVERHRARVKHWKESAFACALVEPTWKAQQSFHRRMYGAEETAPDETGCLCCSSIICPLFNAGRVGNMVGRYTRPRLDCVVGPYWPMLFLITYPLIFGVSGWVFISKVLSGSLHPSLALAWMMLTTGLIVALACTGCRDPGIMYRYEQPPPQFENIWRYSEQALSYRPRTAIYDPDTAVIVADFDHT
jgi:hypothetical protein